MAVRKSKKDLSSLKAKPCNHPRDHRIKAWNRKGREFEECEACEAFLGFTGRTRDNGKRKTQA